jgi:hypothetical protein
MSIGYHSLEIAQQKKHEFETVGNRSGHHFGIVHPEGFTGGYQIVNLDANAGGWTCPICKNEPIGKHLPHEKLLP